MMLDINGDMNCPVSRKVPYAEGDEVEVKFMGYDDRKKMKLSRKVLLPRPPRPEQKPREERPNPENGENQQADQPQS